MARRISLLERLIAALRVLPGVGAKTSQRMAFHLLTRNLDGARELAVALEDAASLIHLCERCRMLTEDDLCRYCLATGRDSQTLCVVETPADIMAIESSGTFSGRYFVLHGRLSPLEGLGPDKLGMDLLFERIKNEGLAEIILATSPTVEGDATAHFIKARAEGLNLRISRLARGVPTGGELEYLDGRTVGVAMSERVHI